MTRAPSLKLRAYLALTAAGTIAGLALGQPELVALVAPFAAYVALGLARSRAPVVAIAAELGRERVLEGDPVPVIVQLDAADDVGRLELELRPRRELTPIGEIRLGLALRAGERREARFELRADRWGGHPAGAVASRARDRFGLIEYELPPLALGPLRVFPTAEKLRALIDPTELQATAGSRIARDFGEGIEFAEVRPFLPGDRLRRINWRVTARRGVPYVSERHPERNADVILFLDTFADVGDESASTLTLAVRAAATLAAAYLARKDRVGVVGFGGVLHGLGPGLGTAQLYRILDALIGSEVVFSYAHKDVSFIPRQLLPSKALVVAITPLIDGRSIGALFDLRARGFDLTVIDVSPIPFARAGATAPEAVAHRLWLLQRDALRWRFERLGAAVIAWDGSTALQAPLASAAGFRRQMRRPVAV